MELKCCTATVPSPWKAYRRRKGEDIYGIVTNGTHVKNAIALKNSTLNVPNGNGIYFPSTGTVTIENSIINAKYVGVQMCAGSLAVRGAQTAS